LPSGVDVDDQGRWVRAGEVLALESDRTGLALARAQGFVVQERIQLERLGIALVRLKAPAGKVLRNAVEELRALDQQNAYDYNHIYQLSQSATKPAAPRAGAGNPKRAPPPKPVVLPRGPTIGMIDGAVSAVHPALRGAAIEQRDFTRAGGAKAVDHGTAVASLLVGEDRPSFVGAAPGGRLLAGAVVDSGAANGALASADAMVRALDWTVAHGASVVNISLAGPPNELLAAAIQEAQKRGVVVVAAVGNDGPAAPPRYPAAYEGVIGVTAVDRAGSIYRRAGRGGHVDLAAYGVEVVAADPAKKYAPVTGTSFAAPQVAALIARTYAQPRPGGVQVVIEDLNRKARDRGEKGKDPIFGVGVIGVEGEP
jgi:subtilisin family serine protease